MSHIVAIVGKPNVGKSTLFNRIVRRRKAIVDSVPGASRDRNYADVSWKGKNFTLVDTGGFEPCREQSQSLLKQVWEQTRLAIEEANLIIFLADGKEGITATDIDLVKILRETEKPVIYGINKIDGPKDRKNTYDFYQLGIDRFFTISAKNNLEINEFMDETARLLPPSDSKIWKQEIIRVAVLGRPNVGKSSLINKILGSKRLVVSELPGTTRDAIDTPFQLNDRKYLLIDTAGIRRKSRISQQLEKYCVVEALKSIDHCDVALILIDTTQEISTQDAKIASLVYEKGKACIIVANKWDLISKDNSTTGKYIKEINHSLNFLDFAPIIFVSSLTGQRVIKVFNLIDEVFNQYQSRVSSYQLKKVLKAAVEKHHPPYFQNKQTKLYSINQVSVRPPTFAVFAKHPEGILDSYERYLINQIRENLGFKGTPLRIVFRPCIF